MLDPGPSRVLSISGRIYEALLVAYPKEFRRAYWWQMVQALRDLCQEEQRRSRAFGLTRLWVRTVLDLSTTALGERSEAVKWRYLMPLALIFGLLSSSTRAQVGTIPVSLLRWYSLVVRSWVPSTRLELGSGLSLWACGYRRWASRCTKTTNLGRV